jgi:hypothetical protein
MSETHAQNPLQASYHLDEALMRQAVTFYFRHDRSVLRARIALAAMGVVLAVISVLLFQWPGAIAAAAALLLSVVLAWRLPRMMAARILKHLMAPSARNVLGMHHLEISNGRITDTSGDRRSSWPLSNVVGVHCVRDLLVLEPQVGMLLAIPRSGNFGADSFDTFATKVQKMCPAK